MSDPAPPPPPRSPLLLLLVVAFAFLLASFPARNSDLWRHLAGGRLLAAGSYSLGSEPFSYTLATWTNPSLAYDLALYAGFTHLGGPALVAVKAALVALLAALLLRLGRPEGPPWVVCFFVLLALLAMGPRLQLQPQLVSVVLLGVCLSLLLAEGRALRFLPLLFAVWVNVDVGFWLGLLLVVAMARRVPVWLLVCCVGACLVNPQPVGLATSAIDLVPPLWPPGWRDDPRFASLFATPWQLAALGPAGGYNLAAWGFLLLFGLGGLSFLLDRTAWRDWRIVVWVLFAGLAAWQTRLVPYFAVVAAPIAARNLQHALAAGRGPLLLRASLGLVTLVLSSLTWPGLLQGFHRQDRALGWALQPDPSLVRAAETITAWREAGKLAPSEQVFNAHPDVGDYLAWFAPGERSFLDSRYSHFRAVASEFEELCSSLDPSLPRSSTSTWLKLRDDYHLSVAVLYDPDLRRLGPALRQAALPSDRWQLLRVEGKAVLLGWRSTQVDRLDLDRLAYRDSSPAPGDGPTSLPLPRPAWQQWLEQPPDPAWSSDTGAVYLRLYEDAVTQHLTRQRLRVQSRQAVTLAGLPALASGLGTVASLGFALSQGGVFTPDLFQRPPAAPLLAIRAARTDLAAHRTSVAGWLVLGQAYLALGRGTAEATSRGALPPLAMIRYIQTVTALRTAVTLDPTLAPAHEALAILFTERQYLDLALDHRRQQLRLLEQTGIPGEDETAKLARVDRLQQVVDQLEKQVQDRESRYAVRAEAMSDDPLGRARLALSFGLAKLALDGVLLKSRVELFGVEGAKLQLELLLVTGRAEEARLLLDTPEVRDQPDVLGTYDLPGGPGWAYRFGAYTWFEACAAAATGRYDRACAALERICGNLGRQARTRAAVLRHGLALLVASEAGLGASPALFSSVAVRQEREAIVGLLARDQAHVAEVADLTVVEAMLLLEQGHPSQADKMLDDALRKYRETPDEHRAGLPLALEYRQLFNSARGGR